MAVHLADPIEVKIAARRIFDQSHVAETVHDSTQHPSHFIHFSFELIGQRQGGLALKHNRPELGAS